MLSSSKVWVDTHHPISLLVDPTFSGSSKFGPLISGIFCSISQGNVFALILLRMGSHSLFTMMEKKLRRVGGKQETRDTCGSSLTKTLEFFRCLYSAFPDGQEASQGRMPRFYQVMALREIK